MALTRKTLLAGMASAYATVGVLRFPADAAEFSYKFATEQPAGHHMTLRLVEATNKIRDASNGRLDIKMFPGSQLGGQTEMMSQVRSGAVDFITSADFILANIVPVAGISATPFAFSGHKEALGVMEGPVGKYRRDAIGKIGVYAFARSWDEGFRQVTTSAKPIHTPDDIKGLKIRVPDAPVITATFKALGASPVSITSSEMYMALQTHLADGMENPMAALEAFKIYEVQKYCAYTNHIWTAYTMLANADSYNKLPQNLRDLTDQYINEAAALDNADLLKAEPTLEATLRGQGLTFNTVNVDAFRTIVAKSGLYGQLKDSYGAEAWNLLEKAVGRTLG